MIGRNVDADTSRVPAGRFESLLIVVAVALSPLWFVNLGGVNIGIHDILLIVAATLLVLRYEALLLFPSRTTVVGIGLFLTGGVISIGISPIPVESTTNFLQYVLIFLVVLPTAYSVLRNQAARWQAYLGLLCVLNLLMIATAVRSLGGEFPYNDIRLMYGNQNQLYWLVASGSVLNYAATTERTHSRWIKGASLLFACLGAVLVVLGLSLSAMIILGGGLWLVTLWWLERSPGASGRRYTYLFLVSTGLLCLGVAVVVASNWEFFYRQGSLHKRIPQYSATIMLAIEAFPFGTGLETSELVLEPLLPGEKNSVHNFVLAYLLETGILGAIGMIIVFSDWLGTTFRSTFLSVEQLSPFEFGMIAVFASYCVVVLVQPVPVRRFWWLLFAVGWAAVQYPTGSTPGREPSATG